MARFFALGLLLMVLSGIGMAAPARTDILDAAQVTQKPASLTEYFAILDDPSLSLTVADMQRPEVAAGFKSGQAPAEALALGFTNSAVWLRLQLSNTSAETIERMLEIAIARHGSVQFHQPLPEGGYRSSDTGYFKPYSERPYKHRFFVFPLKLAPNSEQVVYLRFQGPDGMDIPGYLWPRDAFHSYERADYVSQAIYFGMVLAMIVFNMLLFIALRDFNYLLYVFFVGSTATNIAAANGLGFEYFWGNSPYWATIVTLVSAASAIAAFLAFTRRMLDTHTLVPRLDMLLKIGIGVQLVMLVGLIVWFKVFLQPMLVAAPLSALLALITGFVIAFKRQRSAIFFLGAFAALCLGGVVTSLRSFGVLPTNAITVNALQFGSAVEMVLLAFALADRYNMLRREKAKAQREALQAEQRVVETLRSSERLLEGRVSERTAELSATITRLKQTQADLVQADKLASLGALVAGVAHELNTPIGNALTTASTLEGAAIEVQGQMARGEMRKSTLTYFVESAVPMVQLIGRSCQRAATLISSFKQVAVDQTSEQRREFDLRALVEDNISALRPSFRNDPWVFEVEVPTGVRCDSYPGPVGQIIASLVNNAVTHAFASRDQGRLLVTAVVKGERVEMVFADNGRGMQAAVLAHIFEPFYTSRLGQGGSGLGLAIALNIATGVLGGALHATSQPGEGSQFLLSFPLVAPHGIASGLVAT